MSIKECIQEILKTKKLTWFGKTIALLFYILCFIIPILIFIPIIYIPYLLFKGIYFLFTGKFEIINFYTDSDWTLYDDLKEGEGYEL